MVQSRELAARFDAYGDWRKRLAQGISGLHEWLKQHDLADAQIDLKVQRSLARLHDDKLIVAFVAEFSRVKHVYDIANRDVESWLRAVMSPLETQVREHHLQLQRRLESVKRIHSASGELEERIVELEQQDEALTAQLAALLRAAKYVDGIVEQADAPMAAANG